MRDLAFLTAFTVSGVGLWLLRPWRVTEAFCHAVALLLEPSEPELETQPESELRLAVRDLTVADTRWGRCNWPAAHYELVIP